MEENQNTENEKKKVDKKVDKNSEKKLSDFWNVHKAEFKKITWPSKDVLLKETLTTIVISLIVGAIIFAYDSAISYTYEKGLSMVKGSTTNNSGENGDEFTEDESSINFDFSSDDIIEDSEGATE